ncbi:hypothetical protein AB205_0193570 [Aquarana catesbeiana]|uniref:Uncharacterized protein n=1 Tax=Aquarana catesbeiana TaxID=8400 RepID=A0A2G9Q7U3_AQUCT|nr:hypothetical protein AB205_0193570 [Aquarana catesbeiana]
MANRRYTSEEAYTFLSMTDSEEEVIHLSDSGSEFDPVDDSGSMTDSSDDGVVVPAKVRRTRPRTSSSVVDVQELQVPRMEQSSTSAAILSGELASTSGLVYPGCTSSTAVSRGDVASPISAVQASEVASTSSVPLPPRRRTQAHSAHSALPAAFANPNWEPTTSAAPVHPPFTGQLGIQTGCMRGIFFMSSRVPLPNEPPKKDFVSAASVDIGVTPAIIVPPVLTILVFALVNVLNATIH